MKKILFFVFLSLIFIFPIDCSANANSDEQWYQLELIVFSQITPKALTSEQWTMPSPLTLSAKTIELSYPAPPTPTGEMNSNTADAATAPATPPLVTTATSSANPEPQPTPASLMPSETAQTPKQAVPAIEAFSALDPTHFLLNNEQQQLYTNNQYQTILHVAWQQPFKKGQQETIHLYGGQAYNSKGDLLTLQPGDADAANAIWQLNGTLNIYLNRFFNIHFNLLFAQPAEQLTSLVPDVQFQNIQNGLAYFSLLQTRRLKTNELNYIDHPLYGVLIKIVPVDH